MDVKDFISVYFPPEAVENGTIYQSIEYSSFPHIVNKMPFEAQTKKLLSGFKKILKKVLTIEKTCAILTKLSHGAQGAATERHLENYIVQEKKQASNRTVRKY